MELVVYLQASVSSRDGLCVVGTCATALDLAELRRPARGGITQLADIWSSLA